ncbi:MAG: peptidylprolyl isomerase [Bdellovibrionaceae bacterium]|nr:peptidylprolyl isomerase [Pseudobdellovibrionaceae bacterium]
MGSQAWTFKEVKNYIELRIANLKSLPVGIKEDIISELIFYSLLKEWAKKNNIPSKKPLLTKEEKTLFLKEKKKKEALKILKSYTGLKKKLITELENKLPTPSIKKQKLFYRKNKDLFKMPEKCLLKQILVKNQSQAKALHIKLLQGKPFLSLQQAHSLKPDPGWVKKGEWFLFDKVCFEEKSPLSPVLKSSFGWHIFFRKEKKASRQKSFSESQKQIIKILKNKQLPQQIENWIKEESSKKKFFQNKNLLDQIQIQYKRKFL